MTSLKRRIIQLLTESRYDNVNRREARLLAELDAEKLMARYGLLVNEETVDELVDIWLAEVAAV